jgi:hypothetical protein
MRSRAGRLAVAAFAWIAIGLGAWVVLRAERQIAARGALLQSFDQRAAELAGEIGGLRTAQQASVAVGQSAGFWLPKAAESLDAAARMADSLRASAGSVTARSALDNAAATLGEAAAIDKRARDFLASGQPLMASDVVFTEGERVAASAWQQVEAARAAERRAFDATYTTLRAGQAVALVSSGLVIAVVVLVLGASGADSSRHDEDAPQAGSAATGASPSGPDADADRTAAPLLAAAARLCTDFGRVRDRADLSALLERAADLMEASGLVVWLGHQDGADLQPVLAHGYDERALARMPRVARAGDNAAAAAYRTSTLQIVPSHPGSSGAIVAPLLSTAGCIGALSAELRSGGEGSESTQALAVMLASQLAGLLTPPAAEPAVRNRTA